MPPKAKGKSRVAKAKAAPKQKAIEEYRPLVDKLFELADDNNSGTINFGEFLAHHKSFLSLGAEAMEPERAGFIDRLETDKEVEHNFHAHDTDHNLCLDRTEFADYMESLFAILGKRIFVDVCEKLVRKDEQGKLEKKEGYVPVQSDMLNEKGKNLYYNIAEFTDCVQKMLAAKADPNFKDNTGTTVLVHAAERADEAVIQMLLDARADTTIHTDDMECAAFKAAAARNLDVLSLLLLPDSAVSTLSHKRRSLSTMVGASELELRNKASQDLVRNMSNNCAQDVKDLIAKQADVNFKDQNGWTPLTLAAFWGKKDVLEVLIRTQRTLGTHKLRIDGRNGRGRTALHTAARKGKEELIPMLVHGNCDPDIQDIDGWTPLHHAAFNGMDHAVEALIEVGCTPDIRGRNGFTPLIATSLSTRSGNLGKKAREMLEVPEVVSFGKRMAPILNDTSLTVYEKLQALLELPGVQYKPTFLRLHEQFFPTIGGPSKVRLQKFWTELIAPLMRRFRSGETDLEPPGPHMSDAAQKDRLSEINSRQEEQKKFVQQWLRDSRGPRPSTDWPHEDNRLSYRLEMMQLLDEELGLFEEELDVLYVKMQAEPGGKDLIKIPAEEVMNPRYCSQLHAHPLPLWLEQPDVAGAFEYLRLVHSGHMGQDDDEAVVTFAELITLGHDFDTGKDFWKNIYRLWLHNYAEAVDAEFQKCIKGIVDRYNSQYGSTPNMAASYKAAKPKSYDRMVAKEAECGTASYESFESRTLAARILDLVRCSICVESPEAAVVLVNKFFRPLTLTDNKAQLVKIVNRFHTAAETLMGYRFLELNIFCDWGERAGSCGRHGKSILHALVGEVQIVLQDYLNVRKRRHVLYKLKRGHFDWLEKESSSLRARENGCDSMALAED